MYRDRLLVTLEGYGAGHWMCEILETFWYCQQMVTMQNVLHGPAFPVTRGATQVKLVSPTLFSVVLYNVIRTCLAMTV